MADENGLARFAALMFILFVPMMNVGLVSHESLAVDDIDVLTQSVQNGATFFRVGTLLGAIGYSGFLVVGLLFYFLFRPVGDRVSAVMLGFLVAGVSFVLAAFSRRMDIVQWLAGTEYLPVSGNQWHLQIVLAHSSVRNMFQLAMFFWAPWGIAFGWLIFHSGFVPRVLGILFGVGSAVLLIGICATVLIPSFQDATLGRGALVAGGIPTAIGEYGTILWLLVFGTQRRKAAE